MQTRSGSKFKLGVGSNSSLLAVALMLGGAATPALAADYQWGEVRARTSASTSIGTVYRTEGRDSDLAGQVGNQNFDKGDPVSTVLKGFADIDLAYRNYGLFLRGNAWYDYELKKGDRPVGNMPNGFTPGKPLSDSGFNSEQKFAGVQLLDAYLYGEWDLGDRPVSGRVGRQALAWGESLFLGGGVNVINPFDVAALRRAGSQLKEAVLPVGMVSGTISLTDNLNLQAFYQYEWEATRLDQCGTFFSVFDGLQEGCLGIYDMDTGFLMRGRFDAPEDGGQYGLAGRYYAGSLNTEFGAYYINYHSRNPFLDFSTMATTGLYSVIFPEDIEVYGLSAATTLFGKTVYGEVAYRPDQPVAGGLVGPYENFENWNFIVGTIFNIPQFMGADELSITAEAGYTRTEDMPENGTFGNTTRDAYGYRVSLSWPFTNVLMGVNVTPSLAVNHDLEGTSANGDFVDDRITGTLGMKFQYLSRYTLDMNYTVNTGGKDEGPGGIKNLAHDRDFFGVALTVDF